MSAKILHVGACYNFIPPFIEFVKENFDFSDHEFMLKHGMAVQELKTDANVFLAKKSIIGLIKYYLQLIIKMHKTRKIILHGLFDFKLVCVLFFMPWLLKKSYWLIWGGDLYVYHLDERNWKWIMREFFRRPVIKNIGHLVTYIKGDYELAKQWYGAKGKYHECLMYTSNLFKEYDVPEKKLSGVNIMVGNSADPTNNHFDVFDKLEYFKDQNLKIHVPLTYGNKKYAQEVIAEGKRRFGDKFKPITEHMPFENYLKFLGLIDIAIFNHKRQQAMGNTITLIGFGKKVFLRRDVSQWEFFKSHKIEVFDILSLDIGLLHSQVKHNNRKIVKNYFSDENFLQQLKSLFN